MQFEWNEEKAQSNKQKHGISFEEAKTVFDDENALFLYDAAHSLDEDRYILLGMSSSIRLLVVCHAPQQNDEVIRIISARTANKQERQQYRDLYCMKDEYDFSKAVKNPYLKNSDSKVAIPLTGDVADYFEQLSQETGISPSSLISLYLQDCVRTNNGSDTSKPAIIALV